MTTFSQDKSEGTSVFPNNFKDLTPPFDSAKSRLIRRVLHENLDNFYGLPEDVPFYRVYHATVESKLSSIAREGLKAFYEHDRDKPRIFVTPSPTLALWHAIENRPHDTLRKKGLMSEDEAEGKPVLLQIQVDKNWLQTHQDLKKPMDKVEYMRLLAEEETIGTKTPEHLGRISTFHDILKLEVDRLKQGQEGTAVGIPFPVDQIPPKFIFIDNLDLTVPIKDWRSR